MSRTTASTLPVDFTETLELLSALISAVQAREIEPTDPDGLRAITEALQSKPHLSNLPAMLLKTYNEIASALDGIRLTREMIQTSALDGLQHSTLRLTEVSSTTESAAMELLNGLDRSLGMLDEMEQSDAASLERLGALRAQINELFAHLQFQDITSQQLQGVMQMLTEVEGRVSRVADLFDQALSGGVLRPGAFEGMAKQGSTKLAFNPDATVKDAEARQAVIDATFSASTAH